jgi:surfactin synthase thioesterase subunit
MATAKDWLVHLTPGRRPGARLLCLPFAGGGAGVFHGWPAALPDWLDVWTVRLPGRESRLLEDPVRDLRAVIAAITPGAGALTELPYAVFGHSMGALTGYELVRALRRSGRPEPALLIASGAVAPHVAFCAEMLHILPTDRLTAALRGYGATPDALLQDPELLELFLPALRADFAVVETYRFRPGSPLSCPIAVFRGAGDREVDHPGCLAWADLTTAPVVQRCFPGGHLFVEESRQTVLDALAALLDTALCGRGARSHNRSRTAHS